MIYSGIRFRHAAIGELETVGSCLKEIAINVARACGKAVDLERPNMYWHLQRRLPARVVMPQLFYFDGNPKSGHLPPHYERIALFSFDKAVADEALRTQNAQPAVLYVLGTAAMAGISEDPVFGVLTDAPDSYAVAMGIGRGPLIASPGMLTENGRFQCFPSDITVSAKELPRTERPAGATQV